MSTATDSEARAFFSVGAFREVYRGHFFDRDTMRCFGSRIVGGGRMFGGRFFVTSEKGCSLGQPRQYHVRAVRMRHDVEDPRYLWTVDTVGGSYRSRGGAVAAAKRLGGGS